jgi:hypothetical protein
MSPRIVALVRAALLAAVTAVLGGLITWASTADWGDLAPYAPIFVAVLRTLEGLVLDRNQEPQAGPLGGHAAV